MTKSKEAKSAPQETERPQVGASFPVGTGRDFPPQHLHLRINLRAAKALDRIRQGADELGMRLDSQKRVVNTADAIQFVLQRIADEMGIQ